MALNIFYEEPNEDRWVPFDRYPRQVIRRIVRGKRRPGGQTRVFLNLLAGLDQLDVAYRVNDYRHARRRPEEVACIVGKPFVLDRMEWKNPILFGAAVFSHPADDPQLFQRRPVRRVLVPGPWMKAMCEPFWGSRVEAWPVGIDTDLWRPAPDGAKPCDVLLYDKILWDRPRQEAALLEPVRRALRAAGCSVTELRYGAYREEEYQAALRRCRSMVFLCEHETQGIAYQQALSAGVPILAWDQGGPWRDPSYFPHKVVFGPVTSVPYWDARCGLRFVDAADFPSRLQQFLDSLDAGAFHPRDYVLDHLTLAACARRYLDQVAIVQAEAGAIGELPVGGA